MATGDVTAAVAALITALRSVRFPAADGFDMQSAEAGSPVPLLPALDYLLLHFSTHVVQRLAELGLQLHGLSDLRFVEGAFKFARGLGMRLALTPAQFLCQGYAERKVQLVHGIVKACRELHNAAARKERLASVKGQHRVRMYNSKQASPRPATQDLLQAQSMDQAVPPNGKQHSRSGALAAPVLPHPGALSLRFKPVADAAACCEGEEHAVLKPDPRLQQHEQQLSATEAEAAELQQASGAEQPRPLPPPLAVLPLPPQVARQEGRKQVAPVSIKCSLPALSYPQLTAAGGPAQLTLPVQSEQQVHRGAAGTQMPGFSWQAAQQASLAQHAAQPQQQGLAACTADPPPQKGALASAQQMQQEDEKQLQASYGTKQQQQQQQQQQEQQQQQQQAWLLTSELQARLRLAEEAAASARHEAEQAREQLQARVTLLEGRMRFLEAGYELRPLQQQQQWERKTQRQQLQRPFPALPAAPGMRSSLADCSVGWDGQKGLDMAPEELHMPLRPAAAAAGPLLPSWEEQAGAGQACSRQAVAQCGGWGIRAGTAEPWAVAAGLSASCGKPPASPARQGATSSALPAAASAVRDFSTTSELISGMQARFADAQDFLSSLQRSCERRVGLV